MRKRNVDKHIWFDRQEAQDLQKKAKKACLTEAALIRLLIRGYEPREKPDERFYDAMRELSAIGNNINQLAIKANALGFVDSQMLKNEALRWHKFQAAIEREFLRPEKSQLWGPRKSDKGAFVGKGGAAKRVRPDACVGANDVELATT